MREKEFTRGVAERAVADFNDSFPDALPDRLIGRQVCFFESLSSTNTRALELAAGGVAEGTVILADRQTAGRGRGEHKWYSPARANLYFSCVLYPELEVAALMPLTIMVGVIAARTLWDMSGLEVLLKWPNDLLINNRKAGGILVEAVSGAASRIRHLVVGVGVNVNLTVNEMPGTLRRSATSLHRESGRFFPRAGVLSRLLSGMDDGYALFLSRGLAPFLERFRCLDYLYGRRAAVNTGGGVFYGRGAGIEADGALRLLLSDNKTYRKIISGSVQVLGRNHFAAGH